MDVYNWETGFFVQDDFKVTPRLTVNLGLRYEIITPFTENNDLLVNFDPNFVGPNGQKGRYVVPSQRTLAAVDPRYINYGVVTADKVGVPRSLVERRLQQPGAARSASRGGMTEQDGAARRLRLLLSDLGGAGNSRSAGDELLPGRADAPRTAAAPAAGLAWLRPRHQPDERRRADAR